MNKAKAKAIYSLRFRLKEPEGFFQEALRYFHNAQETLQKVEVKYDFYQDMKPVQESAGIAYLAVLLALDGFFLSQGLNKSKLPRKGETYHHYLSQYSHHNGRLVSNFGTVHDILHVFVYYGGNASCSLMKDGMQKAKEIIRLVTHSS